MAHSELRRDLVSGDWVVVAAGRAKRPHAFAPSRSNDPAYTKLEGCPFEDPQASGNAAPLALYDRAGKSLRRRGVRDWFVQVFPNKFPVFTPGQFREARRGPFEVQTGIGFHELVVTRDHGRHWGDFTTAEAGGVFRAYRDRYQALTSKSIVQYVAIFHNFGRDAGASLYHPHSQIIAMPVIPPDVGKSFRGSTQYFHEHGRCVHCDTIAWEGRARVRMIAHNRSFVAICPFVSRSAFEVRIFPKRHEPCFGNMRERELTDAGDILRSVLAILKKKVGDPSYNFFIHTSPCREDHFYPHYHWHLEILPKISIWAGFEISTGIEISTVSPEHAAKVLANGEATKKP